MEIAICFQRYTQFQEVDVKDLEDIFKLFEPYFDIRFISEIGIVTGKWYHTEYAPKKLLDSLASDPARSDNCEALRREESQIQPDTCVTGNENPAPARNYEPGV